MRSSLPRKMLLNGTGLLVFVLAVFPVFWMASTAFKPNTEIFSTTPKPLPAHPTLEHFDLVLNGGIAEVSFWEYFANSAILAIVTVVVSGLLALLAATAVARFRFRFRTTFLVMLLVVQMVPLEALVIPLFLDLKQLELYNSLFGLALVYIGFAVPFAIWMLRGFVAAVPRELEEAAAIDGCSLLGIYWHVVLPLARPVLATLAIFVFLGSWNDFLGPLVFTDSVSQWTLPVGVYNFQSSYANEYGLTFAASVVCTVPVLLVFLIFSRQIIAGMTAGALKE
jgi:N,N'-diacetylchitobiose transport system permease protein